MEDSINLIVVIGGIVEKKSSRGMSATITARGMLLLLSVTQPGPEEFRM